MTPIELAALLTAIGSLLGVAWTVYSARAKHDEHSETALWKEAMDIIEQLESENKRLRQQSRRDGATP